MLLPADALGICKFCISIQLLHIFKLQSLASDWCILWSIFHKQTKLYFDPLEINSIQCCKKIQQTYKRGLSIKEQLQYSCQTERYTIWRFFSNKSRYGTQKIHCKNLTIPQYTPKLSSFTHLRKKIGCFFCPNPFYKPLASNTWVSILFQIHSFYYFKEQKVS